MSEKNKSHSIVCPKIKRQSGYSMSKEKKVIVQYVEIK